ncbi:hypothetical protein ASG67_09870 [Sphingomonas sp. Leaf339]|nr:hypothetical protein ASG67_09870 [Sphingomonas sp. Leaf339]
MARAAIASGVPHAIVVEGERTMAMARRMVVTAWLAFAAVATTAEAPLPERLVPGLGEIDVPVNRATARMRIDPAAFSIPILTEATAKRARLRAGDVLLQVAVGPELVRGHTAMARFGDTPRRATVAWAPRPYVAGLDGVVGPGGLAEPVVRFVFQKPLPGERTVTLPMMEQDGPMVSWGGLFARIDVGGKPMRVRFDPHHPHTLATANAGRRLAEAYGGGMEDARFTTEIAFGIDRPVRRMRLDQPIAIGPLSIAGLGVRTADIGNAAAIPEADAPSPDPDEIVVVARDKRYDPERDRLSLGADVLRQCSTLVFDKPAHEIRLTCA